MEEEKRRHTRYQLASPLTGVVEQAGNRLSGSVLNVSAGGYYLHLPRLPEGALKVHGIDDYGEIHYAGKQASGFGHLVRIERFTAGVGIGFGWDLSALDQHSLALINDLVGEQEIRRTQGQVSCRGCDILLAGVVTSALAHDVFTALRAFGAGQRVRISLHDCKSLDSSGVELLMALRDRGLPIVEARGRIAAHLERLRLITTDNKET